jgi:putative endonuclease
MNRKQSLGKYGEERAAEYLIARGYEIIDRNWRSRIGEIDLVANQNGRIVFVEVKTRNGSGFGHPFEAITHEKISRMRRLAADWCSTKQVSGVKVRLDAVSVLISGGQVSIEHLKQVF